MPLHVQPMLATLAHMPADQGRYGFEFKWDGERVLAFWDGRQLRLESRNLADVTGQYPELAVMGSALGKASAVLDGEIVALDALSRPSFHLLQRRMHLTQADDVRRVMADVPICYMVFDMVYHDGRDLMPLSYVQRRELLEGLRLAGETWRTPPYHPGQGTQLLQAARENNIEGAMAKELDSPYIPALRTGLWLKIKIVNRQEFVIGGWVPMQGSQPPTIGALLLGYYDRGQLRYAGSVGTGFDAADREKLRGLMNGHAQEQSPFTGPPPRKDACYIRPALVAEIEFREWTEDGSLRHPSYKGLRPDKSPSQVVRETPHIDADSDVNTKAT